MFFDEVTLRMRKRKLEEGASNSAVDLLTGDNEELAMTGDV